MSVRGMSARRLSAASTQMYHATMTRTPHDPTFSRAFRMECTTSKSVPYWRVRPVRIPLQLGRVQMTL